MSFCLSVFTLAPGAAAAAAAAGAPCDTALTQPARRPPPSASARAPPHTRCSGAGRCCLGAATSQAARPKKGTYLYRAGASPIRVACQMAYKPESTTNA